mgnify:CR=1 FL=1
MAWSYRRSLRSGPLRFNLSRSGIGVSIGVPGFRVGLRPNGRAYRSMGIPGTGLYNTETIDVPRRGRRVPPPPMPPDLGAPPSFSQASRSAGCLSVLLLGAVAGLLILLVPRLGRSL